MTEGLRSLRGAFGSAALLVAFRFLAELAHLAFYIVLSRRFGAEGLGVYAYAMALTALLFGIPQHGVARFLVRTASAHPDAFAGLWRPVVRLSVIGAAVSGLAVGGVAVLLSPEVLLAVALVGVAQLSYAGGEVLRANFAIRERLGRIAYAEFVYKLTLVAAGVPLALGGAPFAVVLLAFPAAGIVYLALLAWETRGLRPSGPHAGPSTLATLKRSAPFLLNTAVSAPVYRQHPILLTAFAGSAASGLFMAAYKPFEALLLCSWLLNAALLPMFARLHLQDKDQQRRAFRAACVVVLLFGALAGVLTAALAEPLVALLYGPGFEAAVPVLQLLSVSLALAYLRQILFTNLNASGDSLGWSAAHAVHLMTSAAGAFLLIPIYGAMGAAAALVLGEALTCAAAALLLNRARRPGERRAILAQAAGHASLKGETP